MSVFSRASVKRLLGDLPYTAEIYWHLRQRGRPLSKSFSLRRLEKALPGWLEQVQTARGAHAPTGRRVLIFATLRYWIEHAVLLGMSLAGQGHEVTLVYLPYANYQKPFNRFDLRRQNLYARRVLGGAAPAVRSLSLLDVPALDETLPPELDAAVRDVALRDAQYTLQVEEVAENDPLYRLRLERNRDAARRGLAWLRSELGSSGPASALAGEAKQLPPAADHDRLVLLTPNGSILEMGVMYQAARLLGIPVVTYEFGEQRGRIWLAQQAEVMRQETDALWQARRDSPLNEEQWEQVRSLFASRQNASLWENFARTWQGQPSQGGERVRRALGLDAGRPVVVLAANVIGDSLTLGRQVFTSSMTEWLKKTLRYFARRPDVQLVVRIHPGERYITGPSVADLARSVLAELPLGQHADHIHLVAALDPINTYDLLLIADLGLVYTTTVGMEMAMSGVAALVVGQTHYRGKGFTLDPDSWEAYDRLLDQALADPGRFKLTRAQVEQAWNYAYRFFFEYPCPFPWHLLDFWSQLETWPLARVFSTEGRQAFGATLDYLVGSPRRYEESEAEG